MASRTSARPTLTLAALAQAPELATLELLETALELSVRSLLAEHPTLAELCDPSLEPLSLRRARHLREGIYPLQRALRRYRAAVLAAMTVASSDDCDDLPF